MVLGGQQFIGINLFQILNGVFWVVYDYQFGWLVFVMLVLVYVEVGCLFSIQCYLGVMCQIVGQWQQQVFYVGFIFLGGYCLQGVQGYYWCIVEWVYLQVLQIGDMCFVFQGFVQVVGQVVDVCI